MVGLILITVVTYSLLMNVYVDCLHFKGGDPYDIHYNGTHNKN